MLDDLAKLIFDYSKNYKFADKYFVEKAIDIIINYYKINDHIKEISIIYDKNKETNYKGNFYDFGDKILGIDLIYEMGKRKYILISDTKKCLYYNLEIIKIILHEFDHALLQRQIDLNETSVDVILSKIICDIQNSLFLSFKKENPTSHDKYNIMLLNEMTMYYYFNHNKAPFERRANIRSTINMDEIVNLFNNTSMEKNIKFYRKKCIKRFVRFAKENYKIYRGYHFTNSPSLDYLVGLNHKNINENKEIKKYRENKINFFNNTSEEYSLYDKILYGLQISDEELKEIKSLNKILYK